MAEYVTDGKLVDIMQSAQMGIGRPNDGLNSFSLQFPDLLYRDELLLLYRYDWLARRVVDIYPQDATKEWLLPISFGKDEKDDSLPDKVAEYLKKLKARKMFRERDRNARLFPGGGFLFIGADDGRPLDKPLNENNIKRIDYLQVFDSYELLPEPGSNQYDPEYFQYFPAVFSNNRDIEKLSHGVIIHKSRILTQIGKDTTHWDWIGDRQIPSDSVLQCLYKSYLRYITSNDSATGMLADHDILIHSIAGLAEIIKNGHKDKLKTHMAEVLLQLATNRIWIQDGNRESSDRLSHNFSGVRDTVEVSREDLTAATGVPYYKIWGSVGKAGISDSGRAEERAWASDVRAYQHDKYLEDVETLVRLIFLAKDGPTKQGVPDFYKIKFASIYEPTPEENAELRSKYATIDKTNIDAGIYGPEEARQRYEGEEFREDLVLEPLEQEELDGLSESGIGLPDNVIDSNATGETDPATDDPELVEDSLRQDDSQSAIHIVHLHGLDLGIQYRPGDIRHGRRLSYAYGHVRRTRGADGMAIDCYLGPDLDSEFAFAVSQIVPKTKAFDEDKYMLGFRSIESAEKAYKKCMPARFFGSIRVAAWEELKPIPKKFPHLGTSRLDGALCDRLRETVEVQRLLESFEAFRGDKNCKKGYSCGAGCISRTKQCRIKHNGAQKKRVSSLKAKAKQALSPGDSAVLSTLTPEQRALVEQLTGRTIQASTPPPGTVTNLSTADLNFDPDRFQYKLVHGKTGSSGSLTGVRKWDANLAGVVQVWADPEDGQTYVINGHNRATLAQDLGVDEITVRYINAADASEARAVGALTNIAEGRGNALDSAKFFRETGLTKDDLVNRGIPLQEKIASQGLNISRLSDSLFDRTVQGDLTVERASIIGGSGLNHEQQQQMMQLVESDRRTINNSVLSELADTVRTSATQSQTTLSLFGADTSVQTLAIEKAMVAASVRRQLSRDKRLFGIVGKSRAATELERAGNSIDVERSADISQNAARSLSVFDQLKNVTGPVSDILNSGASRVASGENRKAVESEVMSEIADYLSNAYQ